MPRLTSACSLPIFALSFASIDKIDRIGLETLAVLISALGDGRLTIVGTTALLLFISPVTLMDYQIVHAIAGRIRVRIPQLASDSEFAGKLQSLIEARKAITSVRINPLAQSIVITYKAKAISLEAMQVQIHQAIEQLSPEPVPSPPTPAPASVPSAVETTQTEPVTASLDDDPWNDQPTSVSEETTPAATIDPPAAIAPQTAVQPEETAAPAPTSPSSEPAPLSTVELAQRLGVTVQALTRHRSKQDFGHWSQAKDPAGIAWTFDSTAKSFHPASSVPDAETPATSVSTQAEEVTGEVSGEALGGMAGETIGTIVGGLIAGPVGAATGEEVGAIVGEAIGGEWGKAAADEVNHFHENRSQVHHLDVPLDQAAPEHTGKNLGEAIGEKLLGEKGKAAGQEIGAAVEQAVQQLDQQDSEITSDRLENIAIDSLEQSPSSQTAPEPPIELDRSPIATNRPEVQKTKPARRSTPNHAAKSKSQKRKS